MATTITNPTPYYFWLGAEGEREMLISVTERRSTEYSSPPDLGWLRAEAEYRAEKRREQRWLAEQARKDLET